MSGPSEGGTCKKPRRVKGRDIALKSLAHTQLCDFLKPRPSALARAADCHGYVRKAYSEAGRVCMRVHVQARQVVQEGAGVCTGEEAGAGIEAPYLSSWGRLWDKVAGMVSPMLLGSGSGCSRSTPRCSSKRAGRLPRRPPSSRPHSVQRRTTADKPLDAAQSLGGEHVRVMLRGGTGSWSSICMEGRQGDEALFTHASIRH